MRQRNRHDLDITIDGEDKVFWLQITVRDLLFMEVLEGQQHLCSVEF